MTVSSPTRLQRLLRHPLVVGPIAGAAAIILAEYIGGFLGWGSPPSLPAITTQSVIHLTIDPASLSISHNSPDVTVFASGLTPHGPVGEELDASSGFSIRDNGEADTAGNITYVVPLSTKLSPSQAGETYRITVIDEATGAQALAYVQLTP